MRVSRYRSTFDLAELLESAREGAGSPACEQYKIFLIGALAGLRRNEIDVLPWTAFRFKTPLHRTRKRQSLKLVGSMTTSRMVIPRGRVSMNITTLATSLASIRLPDSFASFNFSSGQSARSALMTLRDRLRAGDIWVEGSRAFDDFLLPPAASRGQAKS